MIQMFNRSFHILFLTKEYFVVSLLSVEQGFFLKTFLKECPSLGKECNFLK